MRFFFASLLLTIALAFGSLHAQPRQDDSSSSPIRRGIEERLRPIWRLRLSLMLDSARLAALFDSLGTTPRARIRTLMASISQKDYTPTAQEKAERDEMIKNSINYNQLFGNIPRIGLISVPMSAIGRFLGITEDVTPRIRYRLTQRSKVTVRIYSLSSEYVATVVDDTQLAGEYVYDWDLKTSDGLRAPSGDYIAEVLADGNRLLMIKRIEVP